MIDNDGRWRPDDRHHRLRDELYLIRFLIGFGLVFVTLVVLFTDLRG